MAFKRSGPPSRGNSGGGASRGGPSRGGFGGGGQSRGPSRGGFGGGRDGGGERSSFSDRAKRDFGDRPPRGDKPFGDRPPRRDGDRPFNDRPKRDFGDRPQRSGDRPFNDRPKRDFGDRPQRSFGGGDRPFNDRPKRDFGGDNRAPREDRPRRDTDMPFEDRPRRSFQKDGFGSSRKRDDMNTERPRGDRPGGDRTFGDRPKRDFGDRPRPERREYNSDRPSYDRPKRDFDDRGPRRDSGSFDRPQRREGFDKRPDSRNDFNESDEAPKGLMKGHEMLIYGVHAAQAALRNTNRKVTTIWVTDIGEAHLEGAYDATRHPEFQTTTKRDIENKLPAGAVHQGIAIAVEPLDDVYLSDILSAANAPNAERQVVVVLDEVTDPHNVGAVLRSMAMFGAKALIVHKRNAPSITGVMAKTATGAIEHVPMVAVTNLSQALEELKLSGYTCLGMDERADYPIHKAPTEGHIALVLGNEGEGLRAKTRTTCDAIVSIESIGKIQSLNVSNAAAIALYSITKK